MDISNEELERMVELADRYDTNPTMIEMSSMARELLAARKALMDFEKWQRIGWQKGRAAHLLASSTLHTYLAKYGKPETEGGDAE